MVFQNALLITNISGLVFDLEGIAHCVVLQQPEARIQDSGRN